MMHSSAAIFLILAALATHATAEPVAVTVTIMPGEGILRGGERLLVSAP